MNIENFMNLSDGDKQGCRCLIKNGGRYEITVVSGPANFCESCGEVVEKSIQLGSMDQRYCFPCFRRTQVDSSFE